MQDRKQKRLLVNIEIPFSKAEYTGTHTAGLRQRFFRNPFGWECSESQRWNRFERFYIRLFGTIDLPGRMRARLVIRALRKISWKTMIDFGSGRGAYSFYFSRSERTRVWGIDTEAAFVSDCKAVNEKLARKRLDFLRGSSIFETNCFGPDSMDVVLAVEVLQYLPDVQEGFREIQQVLKHGGYMIGHVNLMYRRTPERAVFNTENLLALIKDAGLEPVSVIRVFGRAAKFLNLAFSQCMRSRLLAAIAYPAFLIASLACGGESSRGEHCMVVARKP
jgi:SAM-dependent methyltransferase